MNGPLYYRMKIFNVNKLKYNGYLHNHDEVLTHLKRYTKIAENIALQTNYPWVMVKSSEIVKHVDCYKFIIIPRPMLVVNFLDKLRQLIIYDKYANLCEMTKLLRSNLKFTPSTFGSIYVRFQSFLETDKRKVLRNKKLDADTTFDCVLSLCMRFNVTELANEFYGFLLGQLNDLMKEAADLGRCEHCRAVRSVSGIGVRRAKKTQASTVPLARTHLTSVHFERIPCNGCFARADKWVLSQVNLNVHSLKKILHYRVRGRMEFQSLMQGKRSLVRETLSVKIKAVRGQIVPLAFLRPDQLVLPITKAYKYNLKAVNLIPLDDDDVPLAEEKYFYTFPSYTILKRDPVINAPAASVHWRIAFSRSDFIHVGLADLELKNADFDGDTESAFVVDDPISMDEIALNLAPNNNLRIYQQLRIGFTEPHILYMHKRKFQTDGNFSFPLAKIYNFIRDIEIRNWLSDGANLNMLRKFEEEFPDRDFRKYIEPTRKILHSVLNYIVQVHSDRDGYDFYNFINSNVLRLASGYTDSELYDPTMPQFDYTMGDNLLCDTILKIAFSEAKGSLESLYSLVTRLKDCDQTSTINAQYTSHVDRTKLFAEMTNAVVTMAKKSRDVPLNGHTFFRSSIGYDTISFRGNALCYGNHVISNSLDFTPNSILMPPLIAASITFVDV